jgi:hypothetical protein
VCVGFLSLFDDGQVRPKEYHRINDVLESAAEEVRALKLQSDLNFFFFFFEKCVYSRSRDV